MFIQILFSRPIAYSKTLRPVNQELVYIILSIVFVSINKALGLPTFVYDSDDAIHCVLVFCRVLSLASLRIVAGRFGAGCLHPLQGVVSIV